MKSLQDLRIFIETARLGSLSATARQMELTPAAASAAVKRLEQELAVPLFVRTTRKLRLTPQGEQFLQSACQAIEVLESGVHGVRQFSTELVGQLQVSMPSDTGRNLLLPLLDRFQAMHPQLCLRLHLSDQMEDVFSHPIDVVLRFGFPEDSSMVSLPLIKDNYRLLVASPGYLERHGVPTHPDQLQAHNCLCFTLQDGTYNHWSLYKDGQVLKVRVDGDRSANDGEVVRRWAVANQGIAFKSELDVRQDLLHGHLVRVCPDWRGAPVPLNLLCASRSQLSPAVRALHSYLQQALTAS